MNNNTEFIRRVPPPDALQAPPPAALQAPPLAWCSPHVPVGVNESDPTTCCSTGSAPAALQAPPLAWCSPHVPVGVKESDRQPASLTDWFFSFFAESDSTFKLNSTGNKSVHLKEHERSC